MVIRRLIPGALLAAVVLAGCAGAPWFLGEPLDGKPSIPPTSRAETVADHRRKLGDAQKAGEKVLELAELLALEDRGALRVEDRKRLGDLLKERARDWVALRRPIPLAEDLYHLVVLEPSRARGLAPALRNARRSAGDLWLALGENARAEEEYRHAERLGADRMVFRLRAAWGASPADLDREVLERALIDLPERVLAPFTVAYLADGGTQARLLRRAWTAARVYGPPELAARIQALPVGAGFLADAAGASGSVRPPKANAGDGEPPLAAARVTVVEPAASDRLYGGPTLARVLLPLVEVFPDLTAPGLRAREWSERLIAEDPTSPDSLEVAALIDARAGRPDGAARKLGELVFYSPDRALGYARAARVWERAGLDRRACLAWERAANFGAVNDPRWCDLLACVRRSPGAADAESVARYVRDRAPALACVAPLAGRTDSVDAASLERIPTDAGAGANVASRERLPVDAGAGANVDGGARATP